MEQDEQITINEPETDTENTQLEPQNTDDFEEVSAPQKIKKPRIWEIDFLRGFCVYLMVLDHLAMLIGGFFAPNWYGYDFGLWDAFSRFCCFWFFESLARRIIHPIVLFIFFSISGISCTFSRSNLKRGALLAAVALLYSLATYAAQTLIFEDTEVLHAGSVFVSFGVLHFLAFCILLYAILALATKKLSTKSGLLQALVLL